MANGTVLVLINFDINTYRPCKLSVFCTPKGNVYWSTVQSVPNAFAIAILILEGIISIFLLFFCLFRHQAQIYEQVYKVMQGMTLSRIGW